MTEIHTSVVRAMVPVKKHIMARVGTALQGQSEAAAGERLISYMIRRCTNYNLWQSAFARLLVREPQWLLQCLVTE